MEKIKLDEPLIYKKQDRERVTFITEYEGKLFRYDDDLTIYNTELQEYKSLSSIPKERFTKLSNLEKFLLEHPIAEKWFNALRW